MRYILGLGFAFALFSTSAVFAQESSKPATTIDAWRQAVPAATETQPVEPVADVGRPNAASMKETKATLLLAERSWMEALRVRDADSLNEIISAEFSYATPRVPAVMNKKQYLEHAMNELKLGRFEFEETSVRLFGRTAILNSRLRLTSTVNGSDLSEAYVITDVWINQGGKWLIVSRHESPLKEQR